MNKIGVTLGAAVAFAGAALMTTTTAYAAEVPPMPTSSSMPASSGMPASPRTPSANIKCHMDFSLHGWSAIYKTASGKGTVSCSNGQSMSVTLSVKGGGLTVGKSSVDNGHATFTGVSSIKNVLGSYAKGSAHVGVVNSSQAAVLTKGTVSMALAGTGKGWDIGVDVSSFTISSAGMVKGG